MQDANTKQQRANADKGIGWSVLMGEGAGALFGEKVGNMVGGGGVFCAMVPFIHWVECRQWPADPQGLFTSSFAALIHARGHA